MKYKFFTAAAVLAIGLSLGGCSARNSNNNAANDIGRIFDGNETTTNNTRDNNSAVGNIARDTKNGVEDTLRDAGDGVSDMLKGAGNTIRDGANDIMGDGKVNSGNTGKSTGDAGVIGGVTGNTVSDNAGDGMQGNAGANPTGATAG